MYSIPANTKHLYNFRTMLDQRRRCWADVVQMLYKCFVFAGIASLRDYSTTLFQSWINIVIVHCKPLL